MDWLSQFDADFLIRLAIVAKVESELINLTGSYYSPTTAFTDWYLTDTKAESPVSIPSQSVSKRYQSLDAECPICHAPDYGKCACDPELVNKTLQAREGAAI